LFGADDAELRRVNFGGVDDECAPADEEGWGARPVPVVPVMRKSHRP
jgi:hypothetical protein